ncbi:hypothetical protein [Streptomyces sp. SYP-A7185]|uniref:hypothetical protein n=1 Tax=Streptomyces sp. SYP-A7185 TaxID=3040076 RepID=UPI0038F71057
MSDFSDARNPDKSAGNPTHDQYADTDTWTWAGEMVRGLPPISRDDVLKISAYRSAFPWLPVSLKRDPAGGTA